MIYKFKKKSKLNIKILETGIIGILVVIFIFTAIYDINNNDIIDAKKDYQYTSETMSFATIINQNDYAIQRIIEQYKCSNIEIYYPVTKYETLNKEIKAIIDKKIANFKENVTDNTKYSILINFDIYKYNDYIGFLFHVLEDYAGAHPNTYVFSVNYNIKNDKIINIDSLIEKNNNILKLMSKYTYTILSENTKIREINMPYMVSNGTKPIKTNFDKFVFTQEGLIVFFQNYQVAPHSAGEFAVTIPYEELNLKVND